MKEGSDANKNGIICIILCFVAISILAQFTRFRVTIWIEKNLLM